jgi:two-component sensor histidine kinase
MRGECPPPGYGAQKERGDATRSVDLRLVAGPEAPRAARVVRACRQLDATTSDVALLITSELVTNAVLHPRHRGPGMSTERRIVVTFRCSARGQTARVLGFQPDMQFSGPIDTTTDRLLLAVTDDGTGPPGNPTVGSGLSNLAARPRALDGRSVLARSRRLRYRGFIGGSP